MAGGDPSLEPIPHLEVVPLGQGQELLQCLGRDVSGQGDRLNALSKQVGELSMDIDAQTIARVVLARVS
jgi:hypothetical protein